MVNWLSLLLWATGHCCHYQNELAKSLEIMNRWWEQTESVIQQKRYRWKFVVKKEWKKGRRKITALSLRENNGIHQHTPMSSTRKKEDFLSHPRPSIKTDLQICQRGKYVEILCVKCLFLVGWMVIKHFDPQRSSRGTGKNCRACQSLRDSNSWVVVVVSSLSPNRKSQNLRPCQAPARLQSHRTCRREAGL